MQLLSLDERPFHGFDYAVSGPRGPDLSTLPFFRGIVDALPDGLEALVLTSDLQGRVGFARPNELAGIGVAEELERLGEAGVLPPGERIGVVLGGDLYAHPPGDKLGGRGDVRDVWLAFADRFAWVAGVAGNHDAFGSPREARAFASGPNWAVLDLEGGDVAVEFDGLRIAGVSGVVGRPDKPFRRAEEDFAEVLARALAVGPDLLVTHQHPAGAGCRSPGSEALAVALAGFAGVSAFGHKHVDAALWRPHPQGASLATEGRLFVLVGS